jgi:hypothetical protein
LERCTVFFEQSGIFLLSPTSISYYLVEIQSHCHCRCPLQSAGAHQGPSFARSRPLQVSISPSHPFCQFPLGATAFLLLSASNPIPDFILRSHPPNLAVSFVPIWASSSSAQDKLLAFTCVCALIASGSFELARNVVECLCADLKLVETRYARVCGALSIGFGFGGGGFSLDLD